MVREGFLEEVKLERNVPFSVATGCRFLYPVSFFSLNVSFTHSFMCTTDMHRAALVCPTPRWDTEGGGGREGCAVRQRGRERVPGFGVGKTEITVPPDLAAGARACTSHRTRWGSVCDMLSSLRPEACWGQGM